MEEKALPMNDTNGTMRSRREPGRRYQVDAGDGSWWELGWDPGLSTFYAQLWGEVPGDADEPVTDWIGYRPHEHSSVASLEGALQWRVPAPLRSGLEADRVAFPGRVWSREEAAQLDEDVQRLLGIMRPRRRAR